MVSEAMQRKKRGSLGEFAQITLTLISGNLAISLTETHGFPHPTSR